MRTSAGRTRRALSRCTTTLSCHLERLSRPIGRALGKLGLVDEAGTVDQVVRSRWPNAKVKNYGALVPGALPFGETLSD